MVDFFSRPPTGCSPLEDTETNPAQPLRDGGATKSKLKSWQPINEGRASTDCRLCWQVHLPGDVLGPWIEDGGGQTSQEVREHGGDLKVFSVNDYLGLSTHMALRRAAADAALLFGLGRDSIGVVPQHKRPASDDTMFQPCLMIFSASDDLIDVHAC